MRSSSWEPGEASATGDEFFMTDPGPARGMALALTVTVAACSSNFGDRKSLFGSDGAVRVSARGPGLAATAARWDLNGDGAVTCDEWRGYVAPLFQRLDVNGDGGLDATELASLEPADPVFKGADLTVFDEDGNGRVSRQELLAKPNPVFGRLDRDRDCRLAPEELRPGSAGGADRDRRARGGSTNRRPTSPY